VESILAVFSDFRSRHQSVSLKQSKNIVGFHEAIIDALVAKEKQRAFELLSDDLAAAEKIMWLDKRAAFDGQVHPQKKASGHRATVQRSRIDREDQ
jgi:DNA-binding FadR family transcriptional regulator